MTESRGLRWLHRWGFALGSAGMGVGVTPMTVLLLYYLTSVVGMRAAIAGLVLALPKIWDALVDPMLGGWTDRRATRLRKRGSFLLVSGLVCFFALYLLFSLPIFPTAWVLAAVTTFLLIVASTSTTVFSVCQFSMASDMAKDSADLSGVFALSNIVTTAIGIFASVATPLLVTHAGGGTTGYSRMAAEMSAVAALFVLAFVWMTRRAPIRPPAPAVDTMSLFGALRATMGNRSFYYLMAYFLVLNTSSAVFSSFLPFANQYVFHGTSESLGVLLGIAGAAGVLGFLLAPFMVRLMGERRALNLGNTVLALSFGALFAAGYGVQWTNWVAVGCVGLLLGALIVVLQTTLVDVMKLPLGGGLVVPMGSYLGILVAGTKLGSSAGGFAAGELLDAIGFVPGSAHQTADTLVWLRSGYSLIPMVVLAIAGIFLVRVRTRENGESSASAGGQDAHDLRKSSGIPTRSHREGKSMSKNSIDGKDLKSLLDELRAKHNAVGCTLGILNNGEIETAASGSLNLATGVECTPDSTFQIASVGKVFTATLMMQLVDEGRVALDEPVKKYLPDFTIADAEAARTVTVRQLLNHTSGIEGDFVPADDPEGPSTISCVRKMALLPSLYPPGQGPMTYCNSGFVVAGRIIEVLTGTTWQNAVMDRICRPLGMPQAYAHPHESLRFRSAMGHLPDPADPKKHIVAPVTYMSQSIAAAGSVLTMSAESLLLFAKAHMADGAYGDGKQLLSAQSARAMRESKIPIPPFASKDINFWGLGWYLGVGDGYRMVGHTGVAAFAGQVAYLRLFPDKGVAFTVQMNSMSAGLVDDIETLLLKNLLGVTSLPIHQPPPEQFSVQASRYVGTYENIVGRSTVQNKDGKLTLSLESKIGAGPPMNVVLEPYRPDVFAFAENPDQKVLFLDDENGKAKFMRISISMWRRR